MQTAKEKDKIETILKFNLKQQKKQKEAEVAASAEAKAAKAKPVKADKPPSDYVYVKPAAGQKKGL